MHLIKEKIIYSDKEETVQLLTLVPDDWLVSRTVELFNVSEKSVKQARELKKEKGILATPKNYTREGIYSETKKLVTEFYEHEEVSRICPEKKDCISIKLEDRSNLKVQKRLLLANLSEIYSLFKSEFSNLSIGFSTFALLRPKCCMPIGVSGSHNVCVCTYHQNVKLMVHAIINSIDYKDVLKLCVCDMSNQNYMLHHCDFCPSEVVVRDVLKEQLQSNNHSETIKYKQ